MILFNRRLGSEMEPGFVLITFRNRMIQGVFQPGSQFSRRQNNSCRAKQNMSPVKHRLDQMLFIQHESFKAWGMPTEKYRPKASATRDGVQVICVMARLEPGSGSAKPGCGTPFVPHVTVGCFRLSREPVSIHQYRALQSATESGAQFPQASEVFGHRNGQSHIVALTF